jgi:AcrR family transcriptional regulator
MGAARKGGATTRSAREGRARDPARTRARILDAAKAEIAALGPGGARVDRIAARAGVDKRMLYH